VVDKIEKMSEEIASLGKEVSSKRDEDDEATKALEETEQRCDEFEYLTLQRQVTDLDVIVDRLKAAKAAALWDKDK